mmetsp:Transcript_99859/g.168531  ORF Transcript_99859/g.168531 Transcript_99859/m.168531 type:complete len:80 (+) Transcript_99859:486-725(+)
MQHVWELFYTCVGAGIDCTHIISAGQTAAKTMCSVGQSKLHRHANTGPRLIAFFFENRTNTSNNSLLHDFKVPDQAGHR